LKKPLKQGRLIRGAGVSRKRASFTDSAHQLQILGLRYVEPQPGAWRTMFENEVWRIDREGDPDYPWLMTRKADGATRRCSALIECVMIVQDVNNDNRWGFEKPCASS
jgi:hypothetical protein